MALSPQFRKRLPSIIAGGCGGVAPHILTITTFLLASTTQTHVSDVIHPAYCLGLLLVALIGASVAYFFEEQNLRKAFLLGVSAPALIAIAQSESPKSADSGPRRPVEAASSVGFILPLPITTAYAAPVENVSAGTSSGGTIQSIPGRFVEVFASHCDGSFRVVFLDASGNALQTQVIAPGGFAQILVPDQAQKINFSAGSSPGWTGTLPNRTGAMKGYEVNVSGKRVFNFLTALGQAPNINYTVSAIEYPIDKAPAGTTGWIFAGTLVDGSWQSRYLNLPDGVPSAGAEASVLFPLNIRAQATSRASLVDQVRINQGIKVLEVKNTSGNNYWLRVSVVN